MGGSLLIEIVEELFDRAEAVRLQATTADVLRIEAGSEGDGESSVDAGWGGVNRLLVRKDGRAKR